ncbi:MAG: hypothetical protein R3E50_07055 [Halioglobus sp.]
MHGCPVIAALRIDPGAGGDYQLAQFVAGGVTGERAAAPAALRVRDETGRSGV